VAIERLKGSPARADRLRSGEVLRSTSPGAAPQSILGVLVRGLKLVIAVSGVVLASLIGGSAVASAADVYSGYSRVGAVDPGYGGRYDVKQGYSKVGYVKASYGGRWDVYSGYSKVGYVKASYGGRWEIYSGYSKVGYVKASYGGRWDIYSGYSRSGYVKGGPAAAAAGAALLLL
jgi:hypothetical protein